MRSALVLNATYEPLSIVPSRRAACLVLADKADIIEDDGTTLHSASLCIPSPLVIRLRSVVKVPRGGEHTWDNVAAACRPCNLSKRDRTPDEAGMRLARPARQPVEMTWISIAVPRVPDAWKPYLAWAS